MNQADNKLSRPSANAAALDLMQLQKLEVVCERFEQDQIAGKLLGIDHYLLDFTGVERTTLARELISLDIEYRTRRGEIPNQNDYSRFEWDTVESAFGSTEVVTKHLKSSSQCLLGATFGAYELVEKIGEGGMGVVYRATQKDPVQREVALKVINQQFASPETIERFQRERSAIAKMNHPFIAKLFDAGETKSGMPYFVMELVSGTSIDDHCQRKHLGIRQRVELFIQVCQAVQHAHQKGVIHRDLKPSNVIVVSVDGKSVPKVIDFGLAKALQPGGQVQDETSIGTIMGTFQYMSPELAASDPSDVDTRTDVFSLGAILYQLLTGNTPLSIELTRKQSLVDILNAIREQEPTLPSRTDSLTIELPKHESVGSWTRQIRGDLDWIVSKALSKDIEKRYDSAAALADDLERFLLHQPVSALRPTWGYQARKFVQRHKLLTVSALSIAACFLMAVTIGIVAFFQIKNERDLARESDRQTKIAKSELEKQNELLIEQRAEIAKQLNKTSRARRQSAAVGTYFTEVFNAVGTNRIGREASVLDALEYTWRTLDEYFPIDNADKISVMEALASTYLTIGEYKKAETYLRKVHAHYSKHFGANHDFSLNAQNSLANVLSALQRHAEAKQEFQEVFQNAKKKYGIKDERTLTAKSNLGLIFAKVGEYELAKQHIDSVLESYRQFLADEHPKVLAARLNLARIESKLGNHQIALDEASSVEESFRAKLGEDHSSTIAASAVVSESMFPFNISAAIQKEGDLVERFRRAYGRNHPKTIELTKRHAERLVSAERNKEAIVLLSLIQAWNQEYSARVGVYFEVDELVVELRRRLDE